MKKPPELQGTTETHSELAGGHPMKMTVMAIVAVDMVEEMTTMTIDTAEEASHYKFISLCIVVSVHVM